MSLDLELQPLRARSPSVDSYRRGHVYNAASSLDSLAQNTENTRNMDQYDGIKHTRTVKHSQAIDNKVTFEHYEGPRGHQAGHRDEVVADTNPVKRLRTTEGIAYGIEEPPTRDKNGPVCQEHDEQGSPMTWRPTWLRGEVLAAFAALFLAVMIALVALLWYSSQHDGIGEARQGFVHVWRFGPTALFTLFAALWARVELQAMRYMPWIALNAKRQPPDEDVHALDYMSMSLPKVLIESIRRKHHLVYLVATISLLLKAQIALSAGLFSLVKVEVDQPVNITVLDSFDMKALSSNVSGSTKSDKKTYYFARAEHNFGMRYPFGASKTAAYQTFEMRNEDGTSSRGTVDAPLKVIVDGLFSDIRCLKLESINITGFDDRNNAFIDLHFEGCPKIIKIKDSWSFFKGRATQSLWLFEELSPENSCPTLPQQNTQFVYFAVIPRELATNRSQREFESPAGIICSPVAWLSKIEVTDNGTVPTTRSLANQKNITFGPDIWDMITHSCPQKAYFRVGPKSILGPVPIDWSRDDTDDPLNPALYDNEVLLASTIRLSSSISPLLGHFVLKQSERQESSGLMVLNLEVFTVNKLIGVSMISLSAIIALFAFITAICYGKTPQMAIWYRDPATLFGSLIFLHENSVPSYQSTALSSRHAPTDWRDCKTSPVFLRSWIQAFFTIFILFVVLSLIIIQTKSDSLDGLAIIDMEEQGFSLFLWTSVPTLVMLCVSLYTSFSNMAFRSLYTLWLLSSRPGNTEQLDESLIDMVGVRTIYRSVHLRAYTVMLSQFLALVCALLTSLASTLFTTMEHIPESEAAQLRQTSWFGSQPLNASWQNVSNTRMKLSSLFLLGEGSNFNYPQNTYYDLVFPVLETKDYLNKPLIMSGSVTIPALRLQSNCNKLSDKNFKIFPPEDDSSPRVWNAHSEFHQPSFICPNGTKVSEEQALLRTFFSFVEPPTSDNTSYFGTSTVSVEDQYVINGLCGITQNSDTAEFTTVEVTPSTQIYIWGEFSWTKHDYKFISAWKCDYTWYEVATDVSLLFADNNWVVDPTRPPQPNLSKSKPWDPPFNIPQPQSAIPEVSLGDKLGVGIEGQLALVLQPHGKLPLEALGDPAQEDEVLEALRQNFGFITGQLTNVENRLYLNESSTTGGPPQLPDLNTTITYEATHRLVQNSAATYAIVTILLAVFLANAWCLLSSMLRHYGWLRQSRLLSMDVKGLAPDGFGSMASMASLLRDSNVSKHLPANPEMFSRDELHGMLGNLSFRMGWFQSNKEPEVGKHFTIGVLEDEEFTFLGSKKEMEGSATAQSQEAATSGSGAGESLDAGPDSTLLSSTRRSSSRERGQQERPPEDMN